MMPLGLGLAKGFEKGNGIIQNEIEDRNIPRTFDIQRKLRSNNKKKNSWLVGTWIWQSGEIIWPNWKRKDIQIFTFFYRNYNQEN